MYHFQMFSMDSVNEMINIIWSFITHPQTFVTRLPLFSWSYVPILTGVGIIQVVDHTFVVLTCNINGIPSWSIGITFCIYIVDWGVSSIDKFIDYLPLFITLVAILIGGTSPHIILIHFLGNESPSLKKFIMETRMSFRTWGIALPTNDTWITKKNSFQINLILINKYFLFVVLEDSFS